MTSRLWYCTAQTSDSAAAKRIRSASGIEDIEHFIKRHQGCESYSGSRQFVSGQIPLALLSTCRQIHQEAAAIPFESNVFIFETEHSVKHLTKWLSTAQRASIATVVFQGSLYPRNYLEWSPDLARLSGLRTLTIFGWLHEDSMGLWWFGDTAKTYLAAALRAAERSSNDSLSSVSVCVYRMSYAHRAPFATVFGQTDPKIFGSFCDEMESLLEVA